MIFSKYINKYYLKYFIFFLIGFAALVLVDIAQLEIPEIVGEIIDGIHQKTLIQDDLKSYMLKLAIIAGLMFVGRFSWRYCLFGASIRIETDIRRDMFKHMERTSQEYLSTNKTGALMALYTNDLETIRRTLSNGMVMFVDSTLLGVLAFSKMWKLNWKLTIISAIPLIILISFASLIDKELEKRSDKNHEAFASLSDYCQETFSGIAVIKAFVKEIIQVKAFRKYNQKNMDTCMDMIKLSVVFDTVLEGILGFIFTVVIFGGGYIIYSFTTGKINTSFTVGQVTMFVEYFDSLIWPMFAVGQLISFTSQGKASVKRISELLEQKIEINDDLVEYDDVKVEGKIEFRDLCFTYPSTDREILHNVSLTINKGEMIGIIGRTGSGKTTLVSSLLRLYNVKEGSIFIDDKDIMKIKLHDVREGISFVPQDNFLFSTTILENIAFFSDDPESIEEDVRKYGSYADVHHDIYEFKDRYHTVLGERGLTVSGGQRQRISIARALIKEAPILILDDSVSAVDTKTEELILDNLRKIRKGKTTIIIAHRISTLETLDKIIVLDDGKVTGFASHDELVNTNDFYHHQVLLQKLEDEAGVKHE